MNRQSGEQGYGQQGYGQGERSEQMEQGADRAREAANGAGEQAAGAMDRGREMAEETRGRAMEAAEAGETRAAEGMDRAASELRDRADGTPVAGAAVKAADGMERSAEYLRNKDTNEMWGDVEQYVRDHPVMGIAGSVAAGFLVGRILR